MLGSSVAVATSVTNRLKDVSDRETAEECWLNKMKITGSELMCMAFVLKGLNPLENRKKPSCSKIVCPVWAHKYQ